MRKRITFLKFAIVAIAVLFVSSAVHAQEEEGPKIINLTELVTPVVGEESMESFPWMWRAAAAWGDFNNDGFLDLLVSGTVIKAPVYDDEGELIPMLNFDGVEIPLPGNPSRNPITQTEELFYTIKSTQLFKNNGDGTFTQLPIALPHLDQGGIAWLDYNNDGYLDVFVAGLMDVYDDEGLYIDQSLYAGLWKNLGPEGNYGFEEVFPAEFTYFRINSNNASSRIIAVADYDNDGWVDIAVQGWAGNRRITYLYKNLEGEGFMRVEYPVAGTAPFVQMNGGTLHWGDFNRDGYIDLLAFGYIDVNATDLANNYDKTLFYDLRPDCNGGTCISGAGVLYINNGDGTFKMPTAANIFPYGDEGSADFGDINNNGYLDFYCTGYAWWYDVVRAKKVDWNIGLFENKKDGSFKRYPSTDVGLSQTQGDTHAWGDINNDGWEDILVTCAHPASIFLNNFGDGKFSRLEIPFGTDNPDFPQLDIKGGTISLVDFDNDGDLDIYTNGVDDWKRQNTRSFLLRNDLDEEEGLPLNLPPSVPANLKATFDDMDWVTVFTWDASTDDLIPQIAIRYNLYVKEGDVIKMILPADLETGRLKVNETLAPIMGLTYKMYEVGEDYEWGVQAIDNAKNASAFAKQVVKWTGIKAVKKALVKVTGKKQAIEIKAANDLQGTLNVYSISGAKLYSKAGQVNGSTVELPAGAYIVKIVSAEGTSVSKVIVE